LALQEELRAATLDAVRLQRDLHEREEEAAAATIRAAGGEIIELTAAEHARFVDAVAPAYAQARATHSPEILGLVNL
jgi:TRAP-type C4-dicarboxylate transport system substrate-binding protein